MAKVLQTAVHEGWDEQAKRHVITVPLPGVSKEAIEVEVKDREIHLAAERKLSGEEGVTVVHQEFAPDARFERRFVLPDTLNLGELDAKFEHGLLRLSIPMSPEKETRKIEIH